MPKNVSDFYAHYRDEDGNYRLSEVEFVFYNAVVNLAERFGRMPTVDEISNEITVAKSAISRYVKLLLRIGLLRRVRYSGSAKDEYRLAGYRFVLKRDKELPSVLLRHNECRGRKSTSLAEQNQNLVAVEKAAEKRLAEASRRIEAIEKERKFMQTDFLRQFHSPGSNGNYEPPGALSKATQVESEKDSSDDLLGR